MVCSGESVARSRNELFALRFHPALPRPELSCTIGSLGMVQLLSMGSGCGEPLTRWGRLFFGEKDV